MADVHQQQARLSCRLVQLSVCALLLLERTMPYGMPRLLSSPTYLPTIRPTSPTIIHLLTLPVHPPSSLAANPLPARALRRTGVLLPRVLFVTSRPVAEGEELTYSYGAPNSGPSGRPCLCGTPACLGFMPHDDV